MTERLISTAVIVPLKKTKNSKVTGRLSIPVAIRELDPHENDALLSFATVIPSRPFWDAREINIVEFEDRLWRPVQGNWTDPEAVPVETVLSRLHDNPLAKAAEKNKRSYSDVPEPCSEDEIADGYAADARDRVNKAAKDLLIVNGEVYRSCHEPTWIVTTALPEHNGILVQPFIGTPGKSKNAVWFAADKQEDAMAFANLLANKLDMEVYLRGEIHEGPFFVSTFNDVAYAEERIIDLYEKSLRTLSDALPDEFEEMAAEIRALRSHDRFGAVDIALRAEMLLSDLQTNDPAAKAVVDAGRFGIEQVRFFRSNIELTADEEYALDQLAAHIPKP